MNFDDVIRSLVDRTVSRQESRAWRRARGGARAAPCSDEYPISYGCPYRVGLGAHGWGNIGTVRGTALPIAYAHVPVRHGPCPSGYL